MVTTGCGREYHGGHGVDGDDDGRGRGHRKATCREWRRDEQVTRSVQIIQSPREPVDRDVRGHDEKKILKHVGVHPIGSQSLLRSQEESFQPRDRTYIHDFKLRLIELAQSKAENLKYEAWRQVRHSGLWRTTSGSSPSI